MSKLRPTLWRTCRVLASEIRLQLLWRIFDGEEFGVGELGRQVGISEQNASIQLRVLNARGLITARRTKKELYYRAEANAEVEHAGELLEMLHVCYEKKMPLKDIVWMATAFTHSRRIEIVRTLMESAQKPGDLRKMTGIARPALGRHLRKLEARRFVRIYGDTYRLNTPKNIFGACLLGILK